MCARADRTAKFSRGGFPVRLSSRASDSLYVSATTKPAPSHRLDAAPIDLFSVMYTPIVTELIELEQIAELVSDGAALLVDGRLALITETEGGGDPGEYPV